MTKEIYKLHLTVRDASIIHDVVCLVYLYGPRLYKVIKMSKEDQQLLDIFTDRFVEFQRRIRNENPDLFTEKYYDDKSWNASGQMEFSEEDIKYIRLTIQAFDGCFKEYEDEDEYYNYDEIRILTSMTNEEILSTYHKLKDFYSVIQQEGHKNKPDN
jgi:hypothetical protein